MAMSAGCAKRVVLIAEDDANDAFFLKRALWMSGTDLGVMVVGDGAEVMRYLKRESPYEDPALCPWPAMVLLDLHMPLVSGLEVLRWLKHQPETSQLPVVMLASVAAPGDREKALELGARGCLDKPGELGDWAKLLASARRLCDVPPHEGSTL
jgi:CheY-like chemotaxis protein